MAVVAITTPPEQVTEQMYDAVNEKMGDEMPAGLIIHTAGRNQDGTFQMVDVWESAEALERFGEERLRPAIAAVMRDAGQDPEQAPQAIQTVYETHAVMGPAVGAAH